MDGFEAVADGGAGEADAEAVAGGVRSEAGLDAGGAASGGCGVKPVSECDCSATIMSRTMLDMSMAWETASWLSFGRPNADSVASALFLMLWSAVSLSIWEWSFST